MRVPELHRRCLLAAASACLACAATLPAQAAVTLQTTVSNISCGISDSNGTVLSDCNTLSFAAAIEPGDTAFLRATFAYHYTDDGLALATPAVIQLNRLGTQVVVAAFEAAAIYFNSSFCGGARTCAHPTYLTETGTPFTPLILGLNQQPDDISGTQDLFVTLSMPSDLSTGFAYSASLFISPTPQILTAPIPEPATVGLMVSGLLALAFMARRRAG